MKQQADCSEQVKSMKIAQEVVTMLGDRLIWRCQQEGLEEVNELLNDICQYIIDLYGPFGYDHFWYESLEHVQYQKLAELIDRFISDLLATKEERKVQDEKYKHLTSEERLLATIFGPAETKGS